MATGFAGILSLAWWIYPLAGSVLLAMIAVVVLWLVSRSRFNAQLRGTAGAAKELLASFRRRYPDKALLRRSRIIECVANKKEEYASIPHQIGVTHLWVQRLSRKPRSGDFRRVLAFGGSEDLWPCFLLALGHPRQGDRFLKWFEGKDAFFSLREMARAGGGDLFDGKRALTLLKDSIDRIREMTGDPDWRVRHFAVKIILNDDTELSRNALWDTFHDGAFQIRRLVVTAFVTDESDRLYEALYDLVLRDTVFAVRKTARHRIQKEFSDRYHPDPGALASFEALHVLDLLTPGSETDRDMAVGALGQDKLELRAAAARYLLREGVLARMIGTADLGDRPAFDRHLRLLRNAAEVDVTDFLNEARGSGNAGTLLMALKLLSTHGPRSLIQHVADRALRGLPNSEHLQELRAEALRCIEQRGDDGALRLLFQEILARKTEYEQVNEMLQHVPARGEELFADIALNLLRDVDFAAREGLVEFMVRLPDRLVVPRLIDIVQDIRGEIPKKVRVDALRALAAMNRPYLLDFVLEHFYLFATDSAQELAANLAAVHGQEFDAAVVRLVEGRDASVRAAVIISLPSTEKKDFLKLIRPAVNDADPSVRSAAISALVLFGDTGSLRQAVDRLRDPVEEVRIAAATAIGRAGSDDLVSELRKIVDDGNEVESVKLAALTGLGASERDSASDLLIDALSAHEELADHILDAIARKTGSRELRYLIEKFKDADPVLREKLTFAFRRMGTAGQDAMLGLLGEEIGSLRPHVARTLEEMGFVEATIRKLMHRDPEIRRDAAARLSLVGTNAAFRGIVQAARDPDPEVRVQVVRALERLETDDGADILHALQVDPERRVRKYTQWALERLKAKAL
ncbi:MAG TPA: HEAT repeat domain-containing protein [Terriglobia bacterium]|nr:HEAT repeat domain-containing protein [Terriglobia bacterium]